MPSETQGQLSLLCGAGREIAMSKNFTCPTCGSTYPIITQADLDRARESMIASGELIEVETPFGTVSYIKHKLLETNDERT